MTKQRFLYDFEHTQQTHGQEYGMPSGHAQSSFYSLFTVLFMIPNMYITIMSILIACNCFQRWVYRNHTIAQIIMGSICGILLFCLSYKVSEIDLHSLV